MTKLKELSSKMESKETPSTSQEHDAISSTNLTQDCDKIKDFRQTPKYSDVESYALQHHHSIGTGLYLTEEVTDLPPRFINKVIKAVESLAAANNIPLNRNPLDLITSAPEVTTKEKNPDPLVYLPSVLENEKRYKNEKHVSHFKRTCSGESSNSHISSGSNVTYNTFGDQTSSNSTDFTRNSHNCPTSKSHFNSKPNTSGGCRNKHYDNCNSDKREKKFPPKNFQRDSLSITRSNSVHSESDPNSSQTNIHPNPFVNSHVLESNAAVFNHNLQSGNFCSNSNVHSPSSCNAHEETVQMINFYQDLKEKIAPSTDNRIQEPRNRYKSKSFSQNSSTGPVCCDKKENAVFNGNCQNLSLGTKSSTKKINLHDLFPDLKSDRSEDKETKLEVNSKVSGPFKNSVSKDRPPSALNRTVDSCSVNNVNSRNQRTFSKTKKVIEYDSREGSIYKQSLNSSPKYSALNSFSSSENKSYRNTVEPDKAVQDVARFENVHEKNDFFSKSKNTRQSEFNHNEKNYNPAISRKNKNFNDSSHKECVQSNNDFPSTRGRKSLDNSSVRNFPAHKRHNSKSSVDSSYSSSKSFDSRHEHNDDKDFEDFSGKIQSSSEWPVSNRIVLHDSKDQINPVKRKGPKQFRNDNVDTKYKTSNRDVYEVTLTDNFNQDDRNKMKRFKQSSADYYEKPNDRRFNDKKQKFEQNSKLVHPDKNFKTPNRDSCNPYHDTKTKDSNVLKSNFNKGHSKFNSNQSNFEKRKQFEKKNQYNSESSVSSLQENSMPKTYKNKCRENGFFIKVEVFEETRNLKYWVDFFETVFTFHFDLERCCHFSDILILSFERKEDGLDGLKILYQQKRKKKNAQNPRILTISHMKYHLVKPCTCKDKIIDDSITIIEKHFECSLSIVNKKMEEVECFQSNVNKHFEHKNSPKLVMLKTFNDSKSNFTQFKEETLRKISEADNLKIVHQCRNSFIRECNAFRRCLPIYSRKQDILKVVRFNPVSVIVADTGSGKSTQLVQYIHHAQLAEGLIICTQPRKLAAISIAQFVSEQIGSAVGKIVGYDVGIEQKCSESTKIIYMTDYCLLKLYLKNKCLKDISFIIIDEAHERSLYTDLILGMLKQCLEFRPDLRIIITSATINPEIFVDYFNMPEECALEVPGRTYPVDVIWLRQDVELGWDYVKACVEKTHEIYVRNPVGDILVFVTSPGESEEAIYLFKRLLSSENEMPELLCLHGKTDIKEQMQIFESARKRRKIVFATNVAETAVTIPGIKYVVDSGMTKGLMFDPKNNKSYLSVTFINKSAAEQRKGRAGRTQSGICYRMYSKRNYYEDMADNALPEILKTNLQRALLKIFELGVDPEKFDFIEAPPKKTISNSVDSLEYLGAIKNKKLTHFGKKISKLPLEPQLSKLVLQGTEAGIGYEMIVIAALVSESGKLFIRNEENRVIADEKKKKFCQSGGDLCTYLEIYKRWKEVNVPDRFRWCVENYLSSKGLNAASKNVDEIMFSLRTDLGIQIPRKYSPDIFKKEYEKILFDSFSENLCVLSGHPKLGYLSPYLPESFFIHPSSTLSYLGKDLPEFLIYNTLMETSRNFLFDVTPISEKTIKMASQTGNFKLPLYSLKCLQVPPKVLGPFGESVLIRYILGKKGSKIQDLEGKIQQLTKAKIIYVDVAVDKGLITIYLSQRFHEKVSSHINEIIEQAHNEMLKEEDVIKLSGTSVYFALNAGGIISDVIMPGEFREIVLSKIQKDSNDIENILKNYGPIQSIQYSKNNIFVTYKKVCDAQKAFSQLNDQNKYDVSPKPYLPNVSDKTLPLYMLNISWCCRPCTGYGSVEFVSEGDLISASGFLSCDSFFLDNNLIKFTPSESNSRTLCIKNLPKLVEEGSIQTKLREILPDFLNVKCISIFRESIRITDADVKEAKQKLSKLISRHIPSNKFVIEVKYPKSNETVWLASVYFDCLDDAENIFMKIKNNATVNSFPLSVKQVFKSSLFCKSEVYNAVSHAILKILKCKHQEGLCNNFSIGNVKVESKYDLSVEFSCINLDELNRTRKILRQFLQGESIDFIGAPKYHFLFSGSHMEQIKKIQAHTNTFIDLDRFRKVITIYGSSTDCQKAKEKVYSLLSCPDYAYTRTFNLSDSCIPTGFLKRLYEKYGYDLHGLVDEFKLTVASVDYSGHTLTLKGLKAEIRKAENTLEELCAQLFDAKGKRQKANSQEEFCSICLDPVSYDFHRLEYCGHASCRQCLLLQIESKTIPLVCAKENCGKLFFLEDIKRIISTSRDCQQLKKTVCAVALQYHVSCNAKNLSYCPTPDCQMIYRVTKESTDYNCPGCRNSTCSCCRAPYHYGMSCEMFKNCLKDEDYSLKAWVKENESSRKYCPSCKAVIEKVDGCNHMECLNCNTHLCWLCLQTFHIGDDVYEHMPLCPKNQSF